MASIGQVRNIGIAAHIDAGKTTVTERILYFTGVTRKVGEVHDGEATMDFMKQEQERGITIASAAISCEWKDHWINIIDTPGHVDFTVEVERSLRVADGMVAVFDAVAGVQPQSLTVWSQADRYHVPRIAFINKMDREGADLRACMQAITDQLDARPLALQLPVGAAAGFQGVVNLIEMDCEVIAESERAREGRPTLVTEIPESLREESQTARRALIEALAEFDDELLERYLADGDESLPPELLWASARRGVLRGLLTPVLCGAAYRNRGVLPLLDAIVQLLPSPLDAGAVVGTDLRDAERSHSRRPSPGEPLTALAFKIIHDPYVGQQTFTRVYAGEMRPGQLVLNTSKGKRERIGRILRIHAKERRDLDSAGPGDIVALVGMKTTSTGDTLCDPAHPLVLEKIHIPVSVISMAVRPASSTAEEAMGKALHRMALEDPSFSQRGDPETKETIISGMGELHLEIVVDRLRTEFGVEVVTSPPKVAYRETITQSAEINHKLVKQTGGRGQFAHVVLRIEPVAGVDFDFVSRVVGGRVPREYVPAVRQGCEDALAWGPLAGYPAQGVRAILEDGSYHAVDSSDLAFRTCASQALRDAFLRAGPQLLEPTMAVEVATPDDYLGDLIGDLTRRRGKVTAMRRYRKGSQLISAQVPLAEMFGYATVLRSLSRGRANHSMEFRAFTPVPAELAVKVVEAAREENKRRGRAG